LEHFLFEDPAIKKLCEDGKLLAFANDMVVISESWSEIRFITERLIESLRRAGLKILIKKSEVISQRNRILPLNENNCETDYEGSDASIKNFKTQAAGQ
jgi:hypothetical protein